MSNLSITEYRSLGRDLSGYPSPVGQEPALVEQNVAFTTTSVQSSAFNDGTKMIRVVADVDARVLFGTNPTALASASKLVPAGNVEYFGIKPGHKVAIITAI